MRTTLNIDDDVFAAARALASQMRISLGEALSSLARRGLQPIPPRTGSHGLPTFDVRQDAAMIPANRAEELLADEGLA